MQASNEVYTVLGSGHTEKIYEGALQREFLLRNINVERSIDMTISYKNFTIGRSEADLIIEPVLGTKIILELKSITKIGKKEEQQLWNYLTCTNIKVGFLLNFSGEHVEIKKIAIPFIKKN
jgi:GxxExxY protein